jgi:surface protein
MRLFMRKLMACLMAACTLSAPDAGIAAGTVQAEQYTVTYDANGGTFDGGSTTNAVVYNIDTAYQLFAHTDNINDAGVATGTYASSLSQIKIITFTGATNLHVDVWYSTESVNNDWLAIYNGISAVPSSSNYASSISGKLGGGQKATKETALTASYDLSETDTVKFYFKSNNTNNYYGYYAIITAKDAGGNYINATGAISTTVVSIAAGSAYKTPTKTGGAFIEWTTVSGGTEQYSVNRDGIPLTVPSSNITVYTKWNDSWYTDYTYTLDTTNSTITLNTYNGNDTDLDVPGTAIIEGVTYAVKLSSTNTSTSNGVWYSKRAQITSIKIETGVSAPQDSFAMFYSLSTLTSLDVSGLDTSIITNMGRMFNGCSSLAFLTLGSNFNTTTATDMYAMFDGCSSLTSLDLGSQFNTSSVTDMSAMFHNCSSLTSLDLGDHFDTSSVIDIGSLFDGCSSLTSLDLGDKFNTSAIEIMASMFEDCSNLMSLNLGEHFNTSVVVNMGNMFDGCSSLASLNLGDHFDTSAVTTMDKMFNGCSSLTSLNLGDQFNTSVVTGMGLMFKDCSSLMSLNLGNQFNTKSVYDMLSMFENCSSLQSIDLSSFNTSKVFVMSNMFSGCSSLLSLDLRSFNTSSVNLMNEMFRGCNRLTSIDVSSFNTSNVFNMSSMFYGCENLESLDVSGFNTSRVSNMYGMFESCFSLPSINVSKFDTSSVTNMSEMFLGCTSIAQLDVSNFNTAKVTDMSSMFNNCNSLTTIDVGNFDTSSVTNMGMMFFLCTRMKTLDLSGFNMSSCTSNYSMFGSMSRLSLLKTPISSTTKSITLPAALIDLDNNNKKYAKGAVFSTLNSSHTLASSLWISFTNVHGDSIPASLEFNNIKQTASALYITKTVTLIGGANLITSAEFSFVLTIDGSAARNMAYELYDAAGSELYQYGSTVTTEQKSDSISTPFITDDSGIFMLKAGQTAKFTNVEAGESYRVHEIASSGYTQTSPAGGADAVGVIGSEGSVASFTNQYQPKLSPEGEQNTSIQISKSVTMPSGYPSPENPDFSFLINVDGAAYGSQSYTVKNTSDNSVVSTGQTTAAGLFTLKAGQYAVFDGIAANTDYSVTEQTTAGWRTAGGQTVNGSTTDVTNYVSFTNILASFGATKTLLNSTDSVPFTFILKNAAGAAWAGAQYYTYDSTKALKSTTPNTTDADGKFTINSGETAIFTGIAAGTEYSISEVSNSAYIQRTPASASGYENQTVDNAVEILPFENELVEHTLAVTFDITSKQTIPDSILSDSYSFLLEKQTGADTYEAVPNAVYTVSNGTADSTYSADAAGKFSVKKGETVRFKSLDSASMYRVTQVTNPLAEGLSVTSENPQSGLVSSNPVLSFADEYATKYSVHLTKINPEKTILPGATFMIYDNIAQLVPIASATSDADGVLSFTNLDYGTTYYIKETSAPDGYNRMTSASVVLVQSQNNAVQVSFGGKTIISTDAADDVYLSADADGLLQINARLTDTTSALMPATGGTGTDIYKTAGISLVRLAVLAVLKTRRKAGN